MDAIDDMDDTMSVHALVREHVLRFARAKGWRVDIDDYSVYHVPSPLGVHPDHEVVYWQVKVRIRAAHNKHYALAKDGQISGIVRLSDNSLLDTLAESPETLRARRLATGGDEVV